MANSRRSRHATARRTRSLSVSKPRVPKPELDIVALREQLAGYKKSVDIVVATSDLQGNISAVMTFLRDRAIANGLNPDETVIHYIRGNSWGVDNRWVLRGGRDYTDAELKKEGTKLLERKKRDDEKAEQKRQKDLATLRRIARELGLPDPTAEKSKAEKPTPKLNRNRNTNSIKPTVSRRELVLQAKQHGIKGADRMTREQLEAVLPK